MVYLDVVFFCPPVDISTLNSTRYSLPRNAVFKSAYSITS